jgi:integrase
MAGKYRDKKSPAWYLSWYEDGKLKRRSIGQVTEAEAEAARVAKERSLHGRPAAGPSLNTWAERYAAWHAQEYPDSYFRVEQILRCHLLPVFGATPLLGITREAVEAYKHQRLSTGASPATVIKEMRTLQAALNAAVEWEEIPRNPIKHVKPPRDTNAKPPRWYTREELHLIYSTELNAPKETTADDREYHRRYRWAWQLFANSGMRRGEGLQLQWRDIGEDEIRIVSEPGARTKSGKWRIIPITGGAREALAELKSDLLFVLPQINPVSLSRAFLRTTARAGIGGGVHCLRHTYCSHLVQAGVPLRTVQVLAGHSSMRVTEMYSHLAPGHLQDAVRGLNL